MEPSLIQMIIAAHVLFRRKINLRAKFVKIEFGIVDKNADEHQSKNIVESCHFILHILIFLKKEIQVRGNLITSIAAKWKKKKRKQLF